MHGQLLTSAPETAHMVPGYQHGQVKAASVFVLVSCDSLLVVVKSIS